MLRALLDYIAERSTGPLFLNRNGSGRLAYSTSYALIRRLARRAEIPAAAQQWDSAAASRMPRVTPTPKQRGGTTDPAITSIDWLCQLELAP